MAQNRTSAKQRGFGCRAKANTGVMHAWMCCPASWPPCLVEPCSCQLGLGQSAGQVLAEWEKALGGL